MATRKTAKSTSTTRTKKKTAAPKTGKARKVSAKKYVPTEEDIRKKAEEIYHERMARGEYGTAEDDWHKAERIIKGLE
jgi:hypothetical protein